VKWLPLLVACAGCMMVGAQNNPPDLSGQAMLRWAYDYSKPENSQVCYFRIRYGLVGSGHTNFFVLGTSSTNQTTNVLLMGLMPGGTYHAHVSAINPDGSESDIGPMSNGYTPPKRPLPLEIAPTLGLK
jgi:hypothetical protein